MARSVLFVCLGNICRSPTAEGVLQSYLAERGLDEEVRVDSAGTGDWHLGERADRRMREAAERRGYALESRSRQVRGEELPTWDLVVAMDRSNFEDLRELWPSRSTTDRGESLKLFSEFLAPGAPVDVPDPYYGGPEGFDRVLDLVESGCPALVDHLLDLD